MKNGPSRATGFPIINALNVDAKSPFRFQKGVDYLCTVIDQNENFRKALIPQRDDLTLQKRNPVNINQRFGKPLEAIC
jgi:hypothetical protein